MIFDPRTMRVTLQITPIINGNTRGETLHVEAQLDHPVVVVAQAMVDDARAKVAQAELRAANEELAALANWRRAEELQERVDELVERPLRPRLWRRRSRSA